MSDFSDDEDESQGELRPKIWTECVSEDSIKEGSINGERSDPNTNTVGVGSKTLDPDDKEYWTQFRLLTRQAFLLDNVKLSESDYPDAVKEVVTRSRLTIIEFNKGEDEPLEQYIEGEMSDDSDADSSINRYKSEYDHNLEDYRDWHYNRAPIVPNETADDVGGTIRNADYNDGLCQAGREEIEVGTDEHSEPGGRARSELTPEKTGRLIDTLDVNSVINDDITVTIRDSTGVSHRQEDEIIMVSMITVDASQGHTKSQYSNSREIRDHVTPVSGEKQDSAAHGDIRLSGKYSIRNVTVVCSDGCDLTHRWNRAEIDWCGISVDRLIWGYHVSCLVRVARYIDMTDIAYCLAPRYIVSRKFIRYRHIETVSFLSLCVWFYDRIGSPYIIMRCSRSIFSKRFTHAYVCMLNHYISIRSFNSSRLVEIHRIQVKKT